MSLSGTKPGAPRRGARVVLGLSVLALGAGCSPDKAGHGEPCAHHADCAPELLCHERRCATQADLERALEQARIETARVALLELRNGLEIHYVQHGRWPASLEALVEARAVDRLEPDPWGEPYRLVEPAPGRLELQSSGPDRALDTDDDLRLELAP